MNNTVSIEVPIQHVSEVRQLLRGREIVTVSIFRKDAENLVAQGLESATSEIRANFYRALREALQS